MAMTQLKPPGNLGAKPQSDQTSSFAKALLEAGGHAIQSTAEAGVEMVGDALSSLLGTGSKIENSTDNSTQSTKTDTAKTTSGNPFSQPFGSSETVWSAEKQEKEWKRREMRILRHREIQQTDVFDARQVETQRKIDQILEQLELLAKELDNANSQARQVQIAVIQGAVNPGDYHVTFFERLLKVVVLLRKSVHESAAWLEMFNSRKSAKKGYWGQFYSGGTQWSMSQERSLATSVG